MITDNTEKKPLAVTVSADMKIGLPQYSSASLFLSISNVTAETTQEEIDEALDAGKLAYSAIAKRVRAEATRIKAEGGV